ncbi:hypothetical protein Tco_1482550 [Tanacetum coccineum]
MTTTSYRFDLSRYGAMNLPKLHDEFRDEQDGWNLTSSMDSEIKQMEDRNKTALAINPLTEAKYVKTPKACQQALWMKQALIDYDI